MFANQGPELERPRAGKAAAFSGMFAKRGSRVGKAAAFSGMLARRSPRAGNSVALKPFFEPMIRGQVGTGAAALIEGMMRSKTRPEGFFALGATLGGSVLIV